LVDAIGLISIKGFLAPSCSNHCACKSLHTFLESLHPQPLTSCSSICDVGLCRPLS
jgi:hypothetical protein